MRWNICFLECLVLILLIFVDFSVERFVNENIGYYWSRRDGAYYL